MAIDPLALRADVLILGGGIAGLWTLAVLRDQGFDAWLLDTALPGGEQTLASQGIIHGGAKYALTGHLTRSAREIAAMPAIWRARLAGEGAPDLSSLGLLADHQYLWSTRQFGSRLAGFFADKIMQERMHRVDRPPEALDTPGFDGQVYRLDEPVLDVPRLQQLLLRQTAGRVIAPLRLDALDNTARQLHGEWRGRMLRFDFEQVILAAGKGNGALREMLGLAANMQLRPLNMVMTRGPLPALHAHCLGVSANPRLTITSYPLADGETLWYLGGQLAEEGVGLSDATQIENAREALAELLPWIDQKALRWACWPVDRAEVANQGRRPDHPTLLRDGDIHTLWPTKLAFAPLLADHLLRAIRDAGIQPRPEAAGDFSAPPTARAATPWERVTWC
ncbi:MAG TPA: FAD-dependent oxidoreductase [Chromatiaceae bacterium]|nr:FAD-dependent oxidoreductase [Chromatiaceae bacterium]